MAITRGEAHLAQLIPTLTPSQLVVSRLASGMGQKLVLLGAGASRPAGYPLAGQLLTSLEQEAHATPLFLNLTRAWEGWEEFRDSLPEPFQMIARSGNPEIVLTLPDLFEATAVYEDDARTREAVRAFRDSGSDLSPDLEKYFSSEPRNALGKAKVAKARLLEVIHWYFQMRHERDWRAGRLEREYLRRVLVQLGDGDAVLTFNWDTLAERILGEEGKWNPGTGYGVQQTIYALDLLTRRPMPHPLPLPMSSVQVLKLHGSFGWRDRFDKLYLEGPGFLDQFGFHFDGQPLLNLADGRAPDGYQNDDRVLAYPSYIKRLTHPALEAVWRRGAELLQAAELVDVYGYSLPESDGAARALLHGLSSRCRGQSVQVTVHDPSTETLARWEAFLGPNARLLKESLQSSGETADR